MVIKQLSKKKKKPEFQNTEESTKTDQTRLDAIDDVKLDNEYVKESESIDDEYTKPKDDSVEK
jgi:hypothetical protein